MKNYLPVFAIAASLLGCNSVEHDITIIIPDQMNGFFDLLPKEGSVEESTHKPTIVVKGTKTETAHYDLFSSWHTLTVRRASGKPIPVDNLNVSESLFLLHQTKDRICFLVGSKEMRDWYYENKSFAPSSEINQLFREKNPEIERKGE